MLLHSKFRDQSLDWPRGQLSRVTAALSYLGQYNSTACQNPFNASLPLSTTQRHHTIRRDVILKFSSQHMAYSLLATYCITRRAPSRKYARQTHENANIASRQLGICISISAVCDQFCQEGYVLTNHTRTLHIIWTPEMRPSLVCRPLFFISPLLEKLALEI